MNLEVKHYAFMKSNIGELFVAASDVGVSHILFRDRMHPKLQAVTESVREDKSHPVMQKALKQLEEYFAGLRSTFDLPLDLPGTEFQQKVWETLITIPYGEQWSYADLAQAIQKPKAMRAVGSANGKNPVSIVVPCHRVIAKSGGLGGYAGGLERKQKLLELENQARGL